MKLTGQTCVLLTACLGTRSTKVSLISITEYRWHWMISVLGNVELQVAMFMMAIPDVGFQAWG